MSQTDLNSNIYFQNKRIRRYLIEARLVRVYFIAMYLFNHIYLIRSIVKVIFYHRYPLVPHLISLYKSMEKENLSKTYQNQSILSK